MDALEIAQAIVNQVSDIVLLADRDGLVWFTGARLTQKLGWAVDEATGRPLWEVLQVDGPKTSEVEEAFRQAMRKDTPGGAHWSPHWAVLRASDGTPVAGWLSVVPLGRPPEDAMVVFRPVESPADERHLWRAVLDMLDEPVIALDRQLRVRELNTAAKALAGDLGSEVIGRRCWTVFGHGDDVPCQCPLPEAFRARRAVSRSVVDGQGRRFEATCWPVLDSDGRPLLVLERLRPVKGDAPAGLSMRERTLLETLEALHGQLTRALVQLRPVDGTLAASEVREVAAALERSRALAAGAYERIVSEEAGD